MDSIKKLLDLNTYDNYWLHAVAIIAIIVSAVLLIRFSRMVIQKFFLHSSLSIKVDPTRYAFTKNAVSFIIFLLAVMSIFYIIPPLRSLGFTLFAGAGIFAAILGFASQAAFSNIISGIFIVAFKPFRVDDIVAIGTMYTGVVEDITLRHTVIRNFENRRIIIPNSVISNEVIVNSSIVQEKVCMHIEMGISYDSDVNKAIQIITEETIAHPLNIDGRTQEDIDAGAPRLRVKVISWGESSVNIRAWAWSNNPADGFEMRCDLFKSIKERFDKEGIEIPFPHRTLVYKQPKTANDGTQAQKGS